jgi:subtilisin family serine protease
MSRAHLLRGLVLALAAALSLTFAASASAARYTVVLEQGKTAAGIKAVAKAGGKVLYVNSAGIAAVKSSKPSFVRALRASKAVVAVAPNAAWKQPTPKVRAARSLVQVPPPISGNPPGTFPNVSAIATGCAQQYQPPGGTGVGPDPLSVCQWDMRVSNASPTGSYAVNRGEGATVGIIDTGVDLTHQDIAPNLDLALSCSFIRPGTPTSLPQEWEATNNCSTKSAVQDYSGHGTHVAGTVGAPINGVGVAGVAPEVTLVGLKAGTAEGFFFLQPSVDAITYAGDMRLDAVNMSFFIDPFLYNCHGSKNEQAIIKAVQRATQYAKSRGVTLFAASGNSAQDLDHPPDTDETSPNFPPGQEVERDIGNNCVVVPTELPAVASISSIGPQKRLSFFSNYGTSTVSVAAGGGASDQAPNPFGRVLNAWSSTAPETVPGNPSRTVEDCETVGPVCFYYGWIQGTSMASPHAAGVAALIRSADPNLPPGAVIARIEHTAMPLACPPDPRCTGGPGHTSFYGHGLLDALAASLASRKR